MWLILQLWVIIKKILNIKNISSKNTCWLLNDKISRVIYVLKMVLKLIRTFNFSVSDTFQMINHCSLMVSFKRMIRPDDQRKKIKIRNFYFSKMIN